MSVVSGERHSTSRLTMKVVIWSLGYRYCHSSKMEDLITAGMFVVVGMVHHKKDIERPLLFLPSNFKLISARQERPTHPGDSQDQESSLRNLTC